VKVAAVILALLLSADAAVAFQSNAVPESDPIRLFREICLSDQIGLSNQAYRKVPRKRLPASARAVLGYAAAVDPNLLATPLPSPKAFLENEFLQQASLKEAFIMLPNTKAKTYHGDICAIVWRGRHYAEANAVVTELFPEAAKIVPRQSGRAMPFTQVGRAGTVAGAAEHEYWTVIYIGREPLLESYRAAE
jgi:hypothetical protein